MKIFWLLTMQYKSLNNSNNNNNNIIIIIIIIIMIIIIRLNSWEVDHLLTPCYALRAF